MGMATCLKGSNLQRRHRLHGGTNCFFELGTLVCVCWQGMKNYCSWSDYRPCMIPPLECLFHQSVDKFPTTVYKLEKGSLFKETVVSHRWRSERGECGIQSSRPETNYKIFVSNISPSSFTLAKGWCPKLFGFIIILLTPVIWRLALPRNLEIISPRAYIFEGPFGGAYFRRGLHSQWL